MVTGRGGAAGGSFLPDHRLGLSAILPGPACRKDRRRAAAAGPGLPAFFREAVDGLYPSTTACHRRLPSPIDRACTVHCRLLPPPALRSLPVVGRCGPPDRRRWPKGPRTPKKGPTRSEGAVGPSNGTLPAWVLLLPTGPDRARIGRFFHFIDMGKPLYPLRCNALRVENRHP